MCITVLTTLFVNVSSYLPKTAYLKVTRTKTSIRYAKENDREKRERRREGEKEREREKGRRRDIERKVEGEI